MPAPAGWPVESIAVLQGIDEVGWTGRVQVTAPWKGSANRSFPPATPGQTVLCRTGNDSPDLAEGRAPCARTVQGRTGGAGGAGLDGRGGRLR